MATNSMFRITCLGGSRTSLLRGFISTPTLLQKCILPSVSASVTVPLHNAPHRTLYTTSMKSSQKQLFELTKDTKHGSQHWVVERAVAVALLAAIPAGAFYPAPIIDHLLAVLLPLHAYWGVNAIIADYLFRPLVPVTKLAWGFTCIVSAAGLIYINVHDVGICKFVAMVLNM